MSKPLIGSTRNKNKSNSMYTICPVCHERVYYTSLHSSLGDIEYITKNTIAVTCLRCNNQFIPDISHYFSYEFTGRCKTRDKTKKTE